MKGEKKKRETEEEDKEKRGGNDLRHSTYALSFKAATGTVLRSV